MRAPWSLKTNAAYTSTFTCQWDCLMSRFDRLDRYYDNFSARRRFAWHTV